MHKFQGSFGTRDPGGAKPAKEAHEAQEAIFLCNQVCFASFVWVCVSVGLRFVMSLAASWAGSGFEVRGSRFEVRGLRFKVRGLRFEVRCSRFKVRGWRFEVRGSRFEV